MVPPVTKDCAARRKVTISLVSFVKLVITPPLMWGLCILYGGDEVAQGQILGIKGTVGERDTMMEGDGDGTMSHRGGKNDKARTHPRQLDAYAQKTESCRPVRVWFDPRVFF